MSNDRLLWHMATTTRIAPMSFLCLCSRRPYRLQIAAARLPSLREVTGPRPKLQRSRGWVPRPSGDLLPGRMCGDEPGSKEPSLWRKRSLHHPESVLAHRHPPALLACVAFSCQCSCSIWWLMQLLFCFSVWTQLTMSLRRGKCVSMNHVSTGSLKIMTNYMWQMTRHIKSQYVFLSTMI